ncbi:MraY family glycosyltransferase [Burkholderia stagnalis]|uniref:MraY family glycosyltransferase n=1 Tax=Burkholderia stagnalis TaxID=1503054 RepID=UPI00075FE0C5|nr:glycosyltransferase family 4 protein [Burkholderia stagnalis]KWI99492.1 glycosyl transferase [Burkholderia stagnalis]KWO29044.1 glycosyl transferase [Burkholderia stagnalis]
MIFANPWAGSTVIAAGAAALTVAILLFLLRSGLAWRIAMDIPNARSLHARPVPRVGGLGIVPVAVAAIGLFAPDRWVLALVTVGLAVVSQIDDRRGLPVRVRFAAHAAAVAVAVLAAPHASFPVPLWLTAGLAFLMLWLINLYNFMDGADGLAGGMTVFGFATYAIAAPADVASGLVWVSAAIAGAALGFLLFNFHPARLFLGDAGSISLGFMSGALGYWGLLSGAWPVWFPALVFAPFIADASITLLRRLLRGERFWQAHREHYYQKMVRLGLGHARTALLWYGAMAVSAALALWALGRSPVAQWSIVAAWYATLACVGAVIDVRWRRTEETVSHRVRG